MAAPSAIKVPECKAGEERGRLGDDVAELALVKAEEVQEESCLQIATLLGRPVGRSCPGTWRRAAVFRVFRVLHSECRVRPESTATM